MKHQEFDATARLRTGGFSRSRLLLIAVCGSVLASGFPAAAIAAVYKCTGAGGKVVFSDQPCSAGQASAAVRESASSPVTKPQDPSEAARAATRARLRSAQTPDCADMADRIASFGRSGGATASNAQMTETVSRYEQQCAARMREAIEAENKRKEEDAQKRMLADAACAEKRRVLNDRRAKLTSLSDADKRAFSTVEAEVARDCR